MSEAIQIEAAVAVRQATEAHQHALSLPVTTPEEYRVAAEELKALASTERQLDKRRKEATAPLDEAKKAIMAWFRPALDSIDAAKLSLRQRLSAYDAKQRQAEEMASAQAVAAIRMGDVELATRVTTAAMATAAAPVAGVSSRQVWDFEIVNGAAIPREYLAIDETKIRLVVKALKGEAVIAGVRVFQRSEMVVKS